MQNNQWILEELKSANKKGIAIDINGVPYTDESLENISLVLQNENYMLDYEGDAVGKIVALHIDLVKPNEKPFYKSLRCTKK